MAAAAAAPEKQKSFDQRDRILIQALGGVQD